MPRAWVRLRQPSWPLSRRGCDRGSVCALWRHGRTALPAWPPRRRGPLREELCFRRLRCRSRGGSSSRQGGICRDDRKPASRCCGYRGNRPCGTRARRAPTSMASQTLLEARSRSQGASPGTSSASLPWRSSAALASSLSSRASEAMPALRSVLQWRHRRPSICR